MLGSHHEQATIMRHCCRSRAAVGVALSPDAPGSGVGPVPKATPIGSEDVSASHAADEAGHKSGCPSKHSRDREARPRSDGHRRMSARGQPVLRRLRMRAGPVGRAGGGRRGATASATRQIASRPRLPGAVSPARPSRQPCRPSGSKTPIRCHTSSAPAPWCRPGPSSGPWRRSSCGGRG